MKKLICKTLFGSSAKASLAAVLGILFFVVLGCNSFGNKNAVEIPVSNSSTPASNSSTPVASNMNPAASNMNPAASDSTPTFTKADASKAEMPTEAEIQEMAKTTLLDFNEAVQDADFTDFHSNIAKEWSKQVTAAEVKTTFQGFIDKNINIEDISSMKAEFSPSPSIEKELGYKTLKIKGRYPTKPNSTKFLLHYIPNGKDWKLSRIEVDNTRD